MQNPDKSNCTKQCKIQVEGKNRFRDNSPKQNELKTQTKEDEYGKLKNFIMLRCRHVQRLSGKQCQKSGKKTKKQF